MKSSKTSKSDSGWAQLASSPSVREQQAAFTCATGLPLTLLPASGADEGTRPGDLPDAFCVQGCMGERSSPRCQRVLLSAEARAVRAAEPVMFRCPSGLVKLLVPVVAGGRHLGSLMAGPFSLKDHHERHLQRAMARLKKLGLAGRERQLGRAWQHSPVVDTARRRAVTTLVCLFADYLGEWGNRLLLRRQASRSPFLEQARRFLAEHRNTDLSLSQVAGQFNLSPCHFCKVFKTQTGLTFTEYRTRVRVERAREPLVGGRLRISEVAFEAGFNSIPHFNRVFRRYVGSAPSEYRRRDGTNGVKKTAIGA